MQSHVDAATAEGDSFGLKPKTLFNSGISAQLDFSASTYDAMPGETDGGMQCPRNLSGGAGVSCCLGNRAIGGDPAVGHFANSGDDLVSHLDWSCWYVVTILACAVAVTCDTAASAPLLGGAEHLPRRRAHPTWSKGRRRAYLQFFTGAKQ
jgi:hypothetical protein